MKHSQIWGYSEVKHIANAEDWDVTNKKEKIRDGIRTWALSNLVDGGVIY